MKSVIFCPHNDDESLFAAYIIQIYQPLVIIVTDSWIQFLRGEVLASAANRIAETKAAMSILGASVSFLHIPDKEDGDFIAKKLRDCFDTSQQWDTVFAPAIEEGGHWQHNLVGAEADKKYGDRVKHYYTYTRTRDYPEGPVRVEATEDMKAKKIAALACYKSQWANCCRIYFTQGSKDEYLDR